MVSEFDLIEAIRARFSNPVGVEVGIGDDTAVLADQFELVTTDMLVEGVHFQFDLCSSADVGWKALTASLSDIAAMGGEPGPYVVSVCLGPECGNDEARGLVDGMEAAAEDVGREAVVVPVGGDLSSSPGPTVVSITLFGSMLGAKPVLRSGAQPGDSVVLLGHPGLSEAGLGLLTDDMDEFEPEIRERLAAAYRRPRAQVDAGAYIGKNDIASAMIDVSDGLAQDLGHITDESNVGASIELANLPLDTDLIAYTKSIGSNPYLFAAGAGEDFCLLATVPSEQVDELQNQADFSDWFCTVIGAIVPLESNVKFIDEDGDPVDLSSVGYEHFTGEQ